MESGFGATAPYTVGVEEEFQLVDPASRGLTPAVDEVLAAGEGSRLITSELSRSCVEMLSPVYVSAADLGRELPGLRREVRDLARSRGVEIVAAGTHPFSEPTEQPLTGGDHNRRVEEKMGWVARTQAIFGLHIHVAVPDGDTAILAVNALAALVQCLVASAGLDEQPPEDALYNAENKWRAVRYGMDADFYDFVAGRVIPARSMARGLVEELRPVARDLGCEEELGGVLEIVELGTGTELQRAAHKRSGSLEGGMDYLMEGTAPV